MEEYIDTKYIIKLELLSLLKTIKAPRKAHIHNKQEQAHVNESSSKQSSVLCDEPCNQRIPYEPRHNVIHHSPK